MPRVAANNLTINRVWGQLSLAVTARIRELPKQLFVTAIAGVHSCILALCNFAVTTFSSAGTEVGAKAQELCESRGGRPGLPVPNSPYGLSGRKATLNDEQLQHSSGAVGKSRWPS